MLKQSSQAEGETYIYYLTLGIGFMGLINRLWEGTYTREYGGKVLILDLVTLVSSCLIALWFMPFAERVTKNSPYAYAHAYLFSWALVFVVLILSLFTTNVKFN